MRWHKEERGGDNWYLLLVLLCSQNDAVTMQIF